jgi:hypothetical protein
MLKGENFVISFNEMDAGDIGGARADDGRSDNYYAEPIVRPTMCCNCEEKI